jgi:hypothetical protein
LEQVEMEELTIQLMVALVQIQPSLAKQLVAGVMEVGKMLLQMVEQVEPLTEMAVELAELEAEVLEMGVAIVAGMAAAQTKLEVAELGQELMEVQALEHLEEMAETVQPIQ